MIRKTFILLLLWAAAFASHAQPFGNEWINYSQQYFKIKVWQDGIYRINRQSLLFAGVNVSGLDPRKFQIYHNGQQQYIHIEGEADGVFDASDYIEFYGQKNDGTKETALYANSSWQPNPYYSNFTDTAVYFLTWSPLTAGLRMNTAVDTAFSSYTPSAYCIREAFYQNPVDYNYGYNNNSTEYTESEGWCKVFGYKAEQPNQGPFPVSIPLTVKNVYSAGPDAEVELSVGGVNNLAHYLSVTFSGYTLTDTYYTQEHKTYRFSVGSQALTTPTSTLNVASALTSGGQNDYQGFYYSRLRYPHTYDFENTNRFEFEVPDATGQSKARLDITGFNPGTNTPILYDLTGHRRILMRPNGSAWQALLPNNGGSGFKKCILIDPAVISFNSSITAVNYSATNFGYFNNITANPVDSAFIIVSSRTVWSQATAYLNYRNITTGGKALLVDIDELTDQFAYGIKNNPLSVRNFSNRLLNTWTSVAPPQHLLLIGKSLNAYAAKKEPWNYSLNMVPSYGVPSSDNLFTAGLDGSLYEPRIPTGRISARNGTEILDYLQKVQEYEAAQAGAAQPWMKEILHFGGGNDPSQQAQLSSYLDDFKGIMENEYFGGKVTTYLKFSTSPIIINQSDSLQAQIDSGVAVMTFFGHASGSGFDQSTDEPSEYNNQGRYPLVVANSCFAGDIHTSQRSVSEKFVLEPRKAAIGFIASVGLGIPNDLFLYSHAFFENASRTMYGASIGQLMQQAVRDIQIPNAINIQTVCQEMALHGDPSLRLNSFTKPDFSVNESSIRFTPDAITTELDTFSVRVDVRNIGRGVSDTFTVRLTRIFPDGRDSVFQLTAGGCYYSNISVFNLRTGGFGAAGINRFIVDVDPYNSVSELDDFSNNKAVTSLFITSNDILPVYPGKYAIHPEASVTLKASTADPLAGIKTYRFEIDTVDLDIADMLNGGIYSPLYRTVTVTDSGGVITWDVPNYQLLDSTVYFWRVANDSIDLDPVRYKWQQSSFIHIDGKTGWAQSQFYQFKADGYENLRYDTVGRKFDFIRNNKSLIAFTNGMPNGQSEYNEIGYKMNGVVTEYNGCTGAPAVYVAVLDSITLDPWNNCGANYGQANIFTPAPGVDCQYTFGVVGSGNCRNRPENMFQFRFQDTAQMNALQNFINQVPAGNYILAYTWFTANYSAVSPSFHNTFNALGFNTASLNDNSPFILLTKKGNTASNQSVIGTSQSDRITLDALLSSVWNRGAMSSTIIGPSKRWESLHWNQTPRESTPGRDQITLSVLGLNKTTDRWDTLTSGISYSPDGKDTTLSWIPAGNYPYLKIVSNQSDDSLRTPPQMDYWRIYFDEAPECAINPNRVFAFYDSPLTEGDTIRLSVAIDNIGNVPLDSLSVDFYMYTDSRQRINFPRAKLDSLRINGTVTASIRVDSTFGLAGNSSLWVEANPFGTAHQEEQFHFNNLASVNFRIDRDVINPILDVTFDGQHILDGDIVSGKPNITIQLQDENRFLALNDTSKFKIYFRKPGSSVSERIYFSVPSYGHQPDFRQAIMPKNSCRIEWRPELALDGIYTFEVEAADISNNESGKYNYKISFEVVNRSTITEVLNYPNPFSTSTRFVFTLTGNEVPTDMKIQIMTVTGKIVREITSRELGTIRIGRNITDYSWDGKDEFGDRLANGLYLYRVITRMGDQDVEKRATEADSYFKKGWGKMYLMR